MPVPVVVIAGRPNVGKSTLFNKIVGRRTSIVKDEPGITRDRIYCEAQWEEGRFILVDTGGFFPDSEDEMLNQIRSHALYGINEADLIIHLMDGKDGLTQTDRELSIIIRETNKNYLSVVNKIDSLKHNDRIYDFFALGIDKVFPISAEHSLGIDDLMDEVTGQIKKFESTEEESEIPKLAIVGRPNVGKSTLVNRLLGKERMLVSPVSGTTRDAVDSVCKYYNRQYTLIDTAGIRKKARIFQDVEHFSVIRAIRSIERCDIGILLLDATAGIVGQDKKIAGLIERAGKGMIMLFNKWDLVEDHEKRYNELKSEIEREMWFAGFASLLTTSGLTKKRITKIFDIVDHIIGERSRRIKTGDLNSVTEKIRAALPAHKGKRVKVYYLTQVEVSPPGFALFVNFPEGIQKHHMRYIERVIRESFSFNGTPIRIYIKRRR